MALMRISSIPQIYRHLNRWREIIGILSKYGLANWLSSLGPEFAKDFLRDPEGGVLARHTQEARIRLALTELGPTFIKLGQVLSTRADLVGVALAEELAQLQSQTPADPPEVVQRLIEQELGRPVAEIFAQFDERAMASASIGQVHRAQLPNGQDVVVKVRHAGVEAKIRVDLDILAGLAQLAEGFPELKNYRPRATVAEFQRIILRELDFARELRHMQQFRRNFAGRATIRIPRPITALSTSQVLVMERLIGIKLTERETLVRAGVDLVETARRGANLYLEMIFLHGFYHADPHPGNLMVLEDNVIGLLDFGMVGRIDEQLLEDVEELLLAVGNRDANHMTSIITRVGQVPSQFDRTSLSLDVADFVAHYTTQQLDEFDLSGALNEMVEMIRRYQITLPARIAMLVKVLVMLEGTSRLLEPKFNLTEIMTPYQRRLALRRLSPGRQVRKLRRVLAEFEHLLSVLPHGLREILEQVQSGKFDVHLDHRGLEPSVNRLVFGLLTSALFLGSSLLLSRNVPPVIDLPPLLPKTSILGLAGSLVSIALGLRLFRAINKSGHLDRRG